MNTDLETGPETKPTDPSSASASRALPLVMTKIRVPRRRPDQLSRRRLTDFIYAHLDRKLILISAPAGYGKTSVLTDFAHDTDLPVCWYTLDPFDRDLRVFLEHLIAAIAWHFPKFGERSRIFLREMTDPGRDLYPLAATLTHEIYDTIPEYFVLILDDYHTVEDLDKITEFLDLFVSYVDENCHLILASRTLPALPNLSLLVARRQAAGLSIDELRFTPKEIQTLAQQNYGQKLMLQQAEELADQTEGWITGLLLTAAPRWEYSHKQVALPGKVNVGLYDYLSRQVLEQQPASLRDFLLASSVLDELSPEMCMTVLGMDHSTDLMDQLRTRNLFVIEFEDDNRLRYHDLFREFLQASLHRMDEARFRELTRRAAEAYAARGAWEQAVSRYLTLQDHDQIAGIIEQTATDLYETGRWDTLVGWIDAIPDAILSTRPSVLIQRAKIHMERGEHAAALALYDRARSVFMTTGDSAWAAYVLAQKTCVLRFEGRYAEAIVCCHEALSLVNGATSRESIAIALALKNLGLCYLGLGQLAEGLGALRQALSLYEKLDASYDVGSVHHDLGLGHDLAGDLEGAVHHYQAALQSWQQLGNPGPWAHTLNNLSVIYSLRGEYDHALQLLNDALIKVRKSGNLRVEAAIWASLGDLHRDLGVYGQARQAYTEGLRIATRASEGFIITYTLDGLGNTLRLQGDLAQARKQLLEALEQAERHGSTYETGLCHSSLGTLACEDSDLAAARRHLNQAVELFEASGFKRELARAFLHRAQVAFRIGEQEEALGDLGRSLTLADQLGFDQFLVVDGQQLEPLLRYAAGHRVNDGTLSRLLDRIQAHRMQVAKRAEPALRAEPRRTLKVYALGKPEVELGERTVQWTTAQSKDVFFCLLQYPKGLRKEELGEIFWPEHAPHRLDGILRSTLYRVRRSLFRDSVIFEEGWYRFNRKSDYWSDVAVFELLLDEAGQAPMDADEKKITLLEEALALYRGNYLDGVHGDWCGQERVRLQERYLKALETLAGLYTNRRELQRAIELYQNVLAQNPYKETAHRGLMRCYYRMGDRAAAIQQYQICARILSEELGVSPMPETGKLYLEIIG